MLQISIAVLVVVDLVKLRVTRDQSVALYLEAADELLSKSRILLVEVFDCTYIDQRIILC